MPTSAQLSSPDSAMSPCPESSAPAEQHLAIPPTSPKFPLQALYCPSSSARNASASSFCPLYFKSQNSTHAPGLSLPPSPAHPSPPGVHTEPVCLPPSAHPPCFHEKERRRGDEETACGGQDQPRITCLLYYVLVESPWENHSISQSLSSLSVTWAHQLSSKDSMK